jgi:CRP-like cAMP-binding protein
MAPARQFANGNRILQALPSSDLALLEPDLILMTLSVRQVLERPNQKIEDVYFPETCVASIAAVQPGDQTVAIGIIGYEGMSGLAVLHDHDRSPHLTSVQVAGLAKRISAAKLAAAARQSRSLERRLLRFAEISHIQTAHTVAAAAKAKLHEHLARWLLMVHDRTPGNELAITHESLAVMLGVRRAGITEALHAFAEQDVLTIARGHITIVDRKRLEKIAGSFYGVPEREHARAFADL